MARKSDNLPALSALITLMEGHGIPPRMANQMVWLAVHEGARCTDALMKSLGLDDVRQDVREDIAGMLASRFEHLPEDEWDEWTKGWMAAASEASPKWRVENP
jgi:hypothetical protein